MDLNQILNEPEGSDITILDVILYNQYKHKNESKTDTLYVIYKDSKERKKVKMIKNPEMIIYFVDKKYRNDFNTPREYLEFEKCYSKQVRARNVVQTVHNEMKDETDQISQTLNNIYDMANRTGNYSSKKEILKWPYTLFSDLTVEDYYRIMLGYHYNTAEHSHIVNKSFLDIESDIYGLTSTEQSLNLDPTNACTVIFTFDHASKNYRKPIVFTFLLRNHERYPQQKYFEDHMDEFIQQCHKEYDEQSVKKDGKVKMIDTTSDYCIKLYDKEADLLTSIFEVINTLKPDTCEVWNIAYDLPKLAARMEKNNLNPIDVMSDSAFPENSRLLELNVDKRAGIDISERKTFIRMTSTTKYIDEMQSYAGIRKGRKAYGANTLDNIAHIELGQGKREFDRSKGIDVTNAAIKDYWNFVLYNIRDVWSQVLIDYITNDCITMIYDSNTSNTAIENLFKQTKYQKQFFYTWYLRKGFIPGNNPNINYIRGETEEYLEYIDEMRKSKERRLELDDSTETDDDDDRINETDQEIAEKLTDNILDIYKDGVDKKLVIIGAVVGNPDHNTDNGIEILRGIYSKHIFDDVMDMDYASEYPWAKYTRSMSKSTQIGRLIIGEKISDLQNKLPLGQEKRSTDIYNYLPGSEFTSNYISHDILSFSHMWFNLPTIDELDKELQESLIKE